MLDGVERIAAQLQKHRQHPDWDPPVAAEELGRAAACYALPPADRWFSGAGGPAEWPETWKNDWWKPGNGTLEGRIHELEKAGALIAEEIERLQAQLENIGGA